MRHLEGIHVIMRDQILGVEAKRVIDAEFREIPPPQVPDPRRPWLAALKAWFGRLFSGRTATCASPGARRWSSTPPFH